MVVFRNSKAIDSQPNQINQPARQPAKHMYNCISNTIAPLIRCERWLTLFILICILFILFRPSQFTLPFSSFGALFFVLIFFDQDILKTFLRLASNDDNSRVAHFQLKYIFYIRFNGPFCVSQSIHFKCFPPFQITYIKISIYFPFLSYCFVVLSIPYERLFCQFILWQSSERKTTDFSFCSFFFFRLYHKRHKHL